MSERDFHAEAIELVTKERSEWVQNYLEGSVPFLSDLDCLKNECERRLRGEALIRQTLGALKASFAGKPVRCADELIAAAEKYLEGK